MWNMMYDLLICDIVLVYQVLKSRNLNSSNTYFRFTVVPEVTYFIGQSFAEQ